MKRSEAEVAINRRQIQVQEEIIAIDANESRSTAAAIVRREALERQEAGLISAKVEARRQH